MNNALYIYRSMAFDGKIHIKIVGKTKVMSAQCKLFRNGTPYSHISMRGDTGVFRYIPKGIYRSTAEVALADGSRVTLRSTDITIAKDPVRQLDGIEAFIPPTDTEVRLYENIDTYFLEVAVWGDQANRLREDVHTLLTTLCNIESFSMESETTAQHSVLASSAAQTCKIKAHIPTEKLADIAARINELDYVAYCVVAPDTKDMAPPPLPPPASSPYQAERHVEEDTPFDVANDITSDITPDFGYRQGYLDPGLGMNVRAAWERGVTGTAATVRHLDFGIYRNHEDLQGDVTVVSSRRESSDCNHGTASAGCIVGTANNSGITGVAHGCRFYFYEFDDIDLIAKDAGPGDIVGLDIHFGRPGTYAPAIVFYNWWRAIRTMTNKGAIVVMAAGNGGNFIGRGSNRFPDHGDSGGILAGACSSFDGKRLNFSNHGHRASLFNAWGNGVATTGYGDMQRHAGNNRNYTGFYGGTSSATPLCVGALALIQSYAIEKHGVFLNAREMTDLVTRTGYGEGLGEGIGYRPNVDKAIEHLANQLG